MHPDVVWIVLFLLIVCSAACVAAVVLSRTEAMEVRGSSVNAGTRATSDLPVAYVWFPAGPLEPDHWSFRCMYWTLMHHREVVLITDPSVVVLPWYLRGRMSVEDIRPHQDTEQAKRFKSVYQPLGAGQPYELHNTLRFFVLASVMSQRHMETVVYLDSDAQLCSPIEAEFLDGHDVMAVEDERSDNSYASKLWVLWCGTSVLSLSTLLLFLDFACEMFTEPYFSNFVLPKEQQAPFYCDMSTWYLFAVASSEALAERWSAPPHLGLPRVPCPVKFLLGGELGFDINSADREPGFHFFMDTGMARVSSGRLGSGFIRSIHFQQSKHPPRVPAQ